MTIFEVCTGITLSAEKDVEGAAVDLRPSMDKVGAASPKVGLLGSKNGKGWYNGSNESLLSSAEKGFVL